VRDVADSGGQSPEYLLDAINCDFRDTERGAAVFCRVGFDRATSSALDGGVSDIVSAIHTIIGTDGTQRTFAFVGDKVFRESGATSWTDVTPVGVTISTAVPKYVITYNDELIVTDGVNEPWRGTNLGSTPITGTEIEINTAGSAWAARGKPTVYGGKLFFLVASIGATNYDIRMVWSEELTAATGYLQDGYTNSWDLVQTGSERIVQIIGTNVALYYFRQDSIGAISGAVNATFTTTSTHDAVSQEIGSYYNAAPMVARGYVWFISRFGYPARFAIGSSNVESLWRQLRSRIDRVRKAAHALVTIVVPSMAYDQQADKVVMASLRDLSSSGVETAYARSLLIFNGETGSYEGRWCIELATKPAVVNDNSLSAVKVFCVAAVRDRVTGEPTIYVGGRRSDDTEGHIWRRKVGEFQVGDNSAACHQSIVTMLTPDEQNVEVYVDEVALDCVPGTTAVSFDYYTSHTPASTVNTVTMAGTGADDQWVVGGSDQAFDHGIQRAMLGPAAYGRWFRGVFYKDVAAGNTQSAFERASYKVRTTKAGPLSP
jgi:hypothetical protein